MLALLCGNWRMILLSLSSGNFQVVGVSPPKGLWQSAHGTDYFVMPMWLLWPACLQSKPSS